MEVSGILKIIRQIQTHSHPYVSEVSVESRAGSGAIPREYCWMSESTSTTE